MYGDVNLIKAIVLGGNAQWTWRYVEGWWEALFGSVAIISKRMVLRDISD